MSPPSVISMIGELIATPSVSSVNPQWDQSNEAVVSLLASWLSDLGFAVDVLAVPQHAGKFNLIARRGSGDDGLVLSGHTDTVPYDEGRWTFEPFRVSERNGRLYGLGVSDMKSFFALVIEALRDLPLDRLKHPLTVLATADEESNMCGARTLSEAGVSLGRYAVIGEPTGLKPVRMHKGIAMDSIRLLGRSGHSSDPRLGNSALEGMHHVMGALLAWRAELQSSHRNTLFEVEYPTLNLGRINGGDNPNRICGECELQIDIRLLPGMSLESAREAMRRRLDQAISGTGLTLDIQPLFPGIPAMETPNDARIVRASEELTGIGARSVAFGTEAPFFNAMGMETVILGPGSIDQAHQPDEHLDLAYVQPAVELIKSLVKRFCLQ